jgi:hypothetical protein
MPKSRPSDPQGSTKETDTKQSLPAPAVSSGKKQTPDLETIRPSEYMRARHPDLFSDTTVVETARLDRAVFDHYLNSLTSRKQEQEFEHFGRKLAEKEICPNLVPQTGPTGGGDSKVDLETYPVSEEVAERWYEGLSTDAARQRWAFAISAKQAWRGKCQADIKKIADTKRGYVRAFFVTNQYVKDKDRGDVQDELKQLYGFDVTILDRTWILEKVFGNRREQLAIDTLGLEQPLSRNNRKGPRDTKREIELEELEAQLNDSERYQGIEYQLVEDALDAALLARGLEKPRVEVDGRFERATRLAERYGTRQQQLRVSYNQAWTVFWWYEDYQTFIKIYSDVELLAKGSSQALDVERLGNIWKLLQAAVQNQAIDAKAAQLKKRRTTLGAELQRLEQDKTRPNTALQAKYQRLIVELVESRGDQKKIKAALR